MERKRRKDCFFGVHFDFHADVDCTSIGANTTPEMIAQMLKALRPDFVQCDCKGHPGLTSYPSQVGPSAPGFAKDNLRIWRDVTAAAGIPLFMHYSGVFDMAAVRANPQWAIVDKNGTVSRDFTSLCSDYSDNRLIPQLCELAERYDVDGVWVDGEAWAVNPDYSQEFLAAFQKETGSFQIPRTADDPDYELYMNYLRQAFRRYLQHYTTQVHSKHPNFQLASNWAFSTYMPEKVCVDVDFLSADYSPVDSYNTARFESRYLASQGMPWDIMGWSFISGIGESVPSTKSACQISREAAVPISLGGGFQVYAQQKRDGSLENWMFPIIGQVSDFCNERKEYCFRAENVPQVGVLLSTYNFYKIARRPVFPDQEHLSVRGIVQALLDSQLSVQMLSEHHLEENLMQYPVLVLPETAWLEEKTLAMLRRYMAQGGHLIAIGPLAAQYFAQEAGVRLERPFTASEHRRLANCLTIDALHAIADELAVDNRKYLESDGCLTGLESLSAPVTALPGTQVIGQLYGGNSFDGPHTPAATCRQAGAGSCTAVWVNLGEKYLMAQRFLVRDFLGKLVRNVFTPMVALESTHLVDVNISRKNSMLLVHLINTSGSHGSERTYTYDEITPLRGITVHVQCPERPRNVTAVPAAAMDWSWQDGVVTVHLEQLDIYTILALEKGEEA